MKLKALVAAVALAAAGASNAAVVGADIANGGGLIFEAWSNASQTSFHQVINTQVFNDIRPAGLPADATLIAPTLTGGTLNGLDRSFVLDASFLSSVGSAGDLQWHVFSVKASVDANSRPGLLTTWGNASATGPVTWNNGNIGSATSGAITAYNILNGSVFAGSSTVGVSTPLSNTAAFAGRGAWGPNFGVVTFNDGADAPGNAISGFFTGPISATTVYAPGTGVGSFFSIVASSTTAGAQSRDNAFGNAQGNGSWILQADGTLTFHLADTAVVEPPAAVPLPAAAWLLGSGLLGLVGVARRKSKA